MRCSGSDVLIHVLIEQGVDTIFGYPGGAVLNIYDALYDYSDRIRHILTVDEQGACYAADGYARATGKTGVVLATSGPGATTTWSPGLPMPTWTASLWWPSPVMWPVT